MASARWAQKYIATTVEAAVQYYDDNSPYSSYKRSAVHPIISLNNV